MIQLVFEGLMEFMSEQNVIILFGGKTENMKDEISSNLAIYIFYILLKAFTKIIKMSKVFYVIS